MGRHSADLPEEAKINPDLKFRFVNHLLSRSPSPKGPGAGTVLAAALILMILVASGYAIVVVLHSLN